MAWRFLLVYFLTAVIDYTAFYLTLRLLGGNILAAQVAGRLFSVPFNYLAVRAKVFESQVRHEVAGPRFVALYTAAFFAAWGLIEVLKDWMPLSRPDLRVVAAKMIAEGCILAVKFFVQKHLIFGASTPDATSGAGHAPARRPLQSSECP